MGNYEQFNQLMLTDNGALTVEQQQFKDLHERICYNARLSAEHWVEMASGIREMRENKRYKAAGFESFGEYTENALGIKERQAYNYVAVIEKLPESFVKDHATVGVTKLALLTSVTEEERDEILEKIDLDTAKTTEINAAVKAAIEERDKATEQLAIALEEKSVVEKENAEYQKEYSDLAKEHKLLTSENEKLRKKLAEKESEAPAVIYQADPEQEEQIKKVQDAKNEAEDKMRTAQLAKEAVQQENDELRKRLEEAEKKILEPVNTAPARVEIKGDALVVFKVKFGNFQDLMEELHDLLGEMNEETAGKCKAAIRAVCKDWGI